MLLQASFCSRVFTWSLDCFYHVPQTDCGQVEPHYMAFEAEAAHVQAYAQAMLVVATLSCVHVTVT